MTIMQEPIEKVITDEPTEEIRVAWDGERFALWNTKDTRKVIILNPREAQALANFINQQLPKEGTMNTKPVFDSMTCPNNENHVSAFSGYDRMKCPWCNEVYVQKPEGYNSRTGAYIKWDK